MTSYFVLKITSKIKTFLWRWLSIAFALCILWSAAPAKTLKEYSENITHLKEDFSSIISSRESEEDLSNFERDVIAEVPGLLPERDKIEFREKTIDIDNTWIRKKVVDYKNETTNLERKKLLLTEIYEHLDAIELKIKELESSSEESLAKDESKQKLKEILLREEFQSRTDEETFLQRMWRIIKEWIYGLFPEAKPIPKSPGAFGSVVYVLQIILYILVFAVIAFLIYKFAPFLLARFRKRGEESETERIIMGEKISYDEDSRSLFSDAERLAAAGDLKAAIRKGYIALLFELAERKVLGLAHYKTNRDYLRDVRKLKELHHNMNGLTLNYERHWYGFEKAEQEDWESFKSGYKKALSKNM